MRRPAKLAGAGGRPFLCDRSPSTVSGAPTQPEGDPDSGGATRVSEGAARRGTAGGGAWPLLRSWRAPPPLLLELPRPAGAGANLAPARAPLRRASPAPAQAQVQPSLSLISNLGPWGRRNIPGRGFSQMFYLIGWAAGAIQFGPEGVLSF
jgi:hypothetical protein